MRTVFFGTPEFAVPTLQRLIESPHPPLAVVSQPDRRRGRGRRSAVTPVAQCARAAGIEVLTGHGVVATSGRLGVASMIARPAGGGRERSFSVDALLMSAGWTPSVHLFSQSRGKLNFDDSRRIFLPGEAVQNCVCVGACNGSENLYEILEAGHSAGEAAVGRIRARAANKPHTVSESWSGGMAGAGPGAGPDDGGRAFVDFQNDVTAKDIRQAVREGFRSIEHVKRFTTNGMATDQGKTSNLHGLAIAAEALDKPIPEVGLTTFRQPFTPVTFGALVGHGRGPLFDVTRRTAMHGWAEDQGAVFEDVGQWKRAWYFPRPGEDMHAAVNRECRTVRTAAGIFDASTLGKIEVVGPDAATFLELMYTNPWRKLAPGRRTGSSSPPRRAVRRASFTIWKTICRPNSRT